MAAYRALDVGGLSSRRACIDVRESNFPFKLAEAADTEGRHGSRITAGLLRGKLRELRTSHVVLDVAFKHADDGLFESSRDNNVFSSAIWALDVGIFVTARMLVVLARQSLSEHFARAFTAFI